MTALYMYVVNGSSNVQFKKKTLMKLNIPTHILHGYFGGMEDK